MQGFIPGFDSDTGLHPGHRRLPAWIPGVPDSGWGDLWGVVIVATLGFLMFRGAGESKEASGSNPGDGRLS